MEWVRVTALAAAPKPESFMLLDFFFLNTNERSQVESSQWCHEPESGFCSPFFHFFCPTDKESRLQTVPAYISGWVAVTQCPVIQSPFSLSSMLMNPYPTSPCWRHAWNCPTRHSANVTAWQGCTADVFVEVVLQHRAPLVLSISSAHSMLIYIHNQIFLVRLTDSEIYFVLINRNTKAPWELLKQNIYSLHSKCVDPNIIAWFTEFPGERVSVTCWREPQSDKWRLPLPWYSTIGALPCATV